jgi:hypothetical protein
MPFTPAHAAAVVPLARRMGAFGSLSALAIGSMSPDFPYFLPGSVPRAETHDLIGILTFCVPTGWLVWLAFQFLVKQPAISLAPGPLRRRLAPFLPSPRLSPTTLVAVLLSLTAGALTHVVWDAFTHGNTIVTRHVPLFREELVAVGGYRVFVYKLLQHASTLAGLSLLAAWILRWYRSAPAIRTAVPAWPRPLRLATLAGVILIPAYVAIVRLTSVAGVHPDGLSAIGQAAVASMSSFGVLLLVVSVAWHLTVDGKQEIGDRR